MYTRGIILVEKLTLEDSNYRRTLGEVAGAILFEVGKRIDHLEA